VLLINEVCIQKRRGSRQRNLEAQVFRHDALTAQRAKPLIGIDRGFGIAELPMRTLPVARPI